MDIIKSETNEIIVVGGNTSVNWRERALAAEKRLEALEYVVAYANDIVEMWPTITMRTLWKMTDKVASIKEALLNK